MQLQLARADYAVPVPVQPCYLNLRHFPQFHSLPWYGMGYCSFRVLCVISLVRPTNRPTPALRLLSGEPCIGLYLRYVLERIAEHPIKKIDDLLTGTLWMRSIVLRESRPDTC